MFWIATTSSASAANVRPTLLERTRKGSAHSVMQARRGCWHTPVDGFVAAPCERTPRQNLRYWPKAAVNLPRGGGTRHFKEVARWEWLGWV